MLTLEWYGNLVHVPEIKVFKYVKMFWFNTSPASVHRVIFSSFNFCLSTLATVSHHLELANTQLCFRDQDNLRHQNSTSPIFARWQWEQKGQKINGGEYSPVCSICFHIYLLIFFPTTFYKWCQDLPFSGNKDMINKSWQNLCCL